MHKLKSVLIPSFLAVATGASPCIGGDVGYGRRNF